MIYQAFSMEVFFSNLVGKKQAHMKVTAAMKNKNKFLKSTVIGFNLHSPSSLSLPHTHSLGFCRLCKTSFILEKGFLFSHGKVLSSSTSKHFSFSTQNISVI